jgi:hypothetical protein
MADIELLKVNELADLGRQRSQLVMADIELSKLGELTY